MVQIIKKEWQITKMYIYEVVLQGISQPSSIIVSIFYKEGEEIMMEEMFGLCDGMNQIASEDVAIKWGISQNDSLENKRCVNVFIFG